MMVQRIDIFGCNNQRCRWPMWGYTPLGAAIGDGATFCGAGTDGRPPYCADHHAMASLPIVQRRVRNAAAA